MKIVMTLVVAGLLVVTASAVSAATNDTAQAPTATASAQAVPTAPTLLVGESLVSNLTGGCGADHQLGAGTPEPTETAAGFCGACSLHNCAGLQRGTSCTNPMTGLKGFCNIYSGGFKCSTGGWECECGSGPLP